MHFQDVILRLQRYWAEQGCLVWQPYNVKVGAGTNNPATFLRVLGPEPWKVAYVEPSVRPADGRFGENPNRWGQYYQFQVILKPDPGNPLELYLNSLRALGIDPAKHDVRFVEDNWQSPTLGAWGLGWEVWLDGQEISQFTYFQQDGGYDLDVIAVEITYGLERIVMALQGVPVFQKMSWTGDITYGDILLAGEVEQCRYNFNVASISRLRELFDLYEAEARDALAAGLVLPAHDYVLLCSHTFNVLDARGAIGVTERAKVFGRMRELSRKVAATYLEQRKEMGFPLLGKSFQGTTAPEPTASVACGAAPAEGRRAFLLEIGTEELPAGDLTEALEQIRTALPGLLAEARLDHGEPRVLGTPRRLVVLLPDVAPVQSDEERIIKGPPAKVAFDAEGKPTKAAQGFARGNNVAVEDLQVRPYEGRDYVVAVTVQRGLPAAEVLGQMASQLVARLRFGRSMRWNTSGVAFSRPVRWLVALLGEAVVPCSFAGVEAGCVSRGIRPAGSPDLQIPSAEMYEDVMRRHHVMLDVAERQATILTQGKKLAAEIGGEMMDYPALLAEVANMVEWPTVIRGAFAEEYLQVPEPALITVMREHQRYFPVLRDGKLLPAFLTTTNGAELDWDAVRKGNEDVLRARYADAAFFYRSDLDTPLADFVPRLDTLTFQTDLGSVLDKVHRLEKLVPILSGQLGLGAEERVVAQRAAFLCKADLATRMVVEHTSLQGMMGAHYALHSGEMPAVAKAIKEHYQPKGLGDALPSTEAGMAVALADRLDSLVGLFAVGLAPSGSADPYALRRAALGVVQILLGRDGPFALRAAVEAAASVQPVTVTPEVQHDVLQFIEQRLRGFLLDQGFRYDVVDAVLGVENADPWTETRAVEALQAATQSPDWGALLVAYARTVRITRDLPAEYNINARFFTEPATQDLYEAYKRAANMVERQRDMATVLAALRALVGPITRFFTDVLVMAEDPEVRTTRLALVQRIAALPKGVADLSRLEGF